MAKIDKAIHKRVKEYIKKIGKFYEKTIILCDTPDELTAAKMEYGILSIYGVRFVMQEDSKQYDEYIVIKYSEEEPLSIRDIINISIKLTFEDFKENDKMREKYRYGLTGFLMSTIASMFD